MAAACPNFSAAGRLNRRQLLRAGSIGLLGLTLPKLLAGRSRVAAAAPSPTSNVSSFGRAKSCILLFMWGGPAHQDTWDLKPAAPAEIRGEFRPIGTNVPGIQICEHFPQLAQRVDRLAIVRSMTHTDVNHTTATHYLLTGQPPPPGSDLRGDWPHIGSVLSKLGRGDGPLPPFVSMRPKLENTVPRFVEESHGQFAGWLGQAFDPLTIDADPSRDDYRVGDFVLPPEVSTRRLDDRKSLLSQIDRRRRGWDEYPALNGFSKHYRRAFDLLHSAIGGQAFDLTREPAEIRTVTGGIRTANRCCKRGD